MDILNSSLLQDGLAGKLDGINSSDIGDKVIDLSVPIPIGTTIHAVEPTAPVETPTQTTVVIQKSGLTDEQKKHLMGLAIGAAAGAIIGYLTKGRVILLTAVGAAIGVASTYTHSQLTNKI